jgi:hypothetical protein
MATETGGVLGVQSGDCDGERDRALVVALDDAGPVSGHPMILWARRPRLELIKLTTSSRSGMRPDGDDQRRSLPPPTWIQLSDGTGAAPRRRAKRREGALRPEQ